jgi:hypothetical protein
MSETFDAIVVGAGSVGVGSGLASTLFSRSDPSHDAGVRSCVIGILKA